MSLLGFDGRIASNDLALHLFDGDEVLDNGVVLAEMAFFETAVKLLALLALPEEVHGLESGHLSDS